MREIDLTPSWYTQSLTERRGSRFRASGLIAMGAIIIMWSYDTTSRTRAAMTELADLAQRTETQDRAAADISIYEKEVMARERYADILSRVGGGIRSVEIIAELSHAMPQAMSIHKLQLKKAPRIAEASDRDEMTGARSDTKGPVRSALQVFGFAETGTDVGSFVSRLSRSPLFDYVALRYQRTTVRDDRRVVEFHVECSMPLFE